MPPKTSKRKAANGYRLPDPIPEGEIFTEGGKKRWRIGKSIGVGGFGEIYLCSDDVSKKVPDDAERVMKVEPSENGPLFVEMHFYVRAAKPNEIENFIKKKGLKDLGMPRFRGKGLDSFQGQNYRFLVIDRFGKDLQKIFQSGKKLFTPKAAFNLALRIFDVLEYIHSQGYVHNDIKAQNLLLGHGRKQENDVYLVDFGLVSKYIIDGVHLAYKGDVRKEHDGTIEYTSRDAHIGTHSRRGDLEILAYNLIHWMSGDLPWMKLLGNPSAVHSSKNNHMSNIPHFLSLSFGEENTYPHVLQEYCEYVAKLDFSTEPDYDHCRKMFRSALLELRLPADGKVDFSNSKTPTKKKRLRMTSSSGITDTESSAELVKSPDDSVALTRSAANVTDWCWESILCSDPESLLRQASRISEPEDESPLSIQRREVEKRKQLECFRNPTAAMTQIMEKMSLFESEREDLSSSYNFQQLSGKKSNDKKNNTPLFESISSSFSTLTPAMEDVIRRRASKISEEVESPITPETSDSENSEEYFPHRLRPPPLPSRIKKKKSQRRLPRKSRKSERKDEVVVSVQNDASSVILNKTSPLKRLKILSVQNDAEEILNQSESELFLVKKPKASHFSSSSSSSFPLEEEESSVIHHHHHHLRHRAQCSGKRCVGTRWESVLRTNPVRLWKKKQQNL